MKRILLTLLLVFNVVAVGFAQTTKSDFLPKIFAGWTRSAAPQTSTDPAQADPINGAVLKEFGFTDLASATYEKEGRKLSIKAARFTDAGGGERAGMVDMYTPLGPGTKGDGAI